MPGPEDEEKKARDQRWRKVIDDATHKPPEGPKTDESTKLDRPAQQKSIRDLIDEKTFDDDTTKK